MNGTPAKTGKLLFFLTASLLGFALFGTELGAILLGGQNWVATLLWLLIKGYLFWRFITARRWALGLAKAFVALVLIISALQLLGILCGPTVPSVAYLVFVSIATAACLFAGWTLCISQSTWVYLKPLVHDSPKSASWITTLFLYGRRTLLVTLTIALCLYSMVAGSTSERPNPQPPSEAINVHFYEWQAWQSWYYAYRFDAPPEVCEKFATELMRQQRRANQEWPPTKEEFKSWPFCLTSSGYKQQWMSWFDVNSVRDGFILGAKNFTGPYAVVDRERGRLYYYNGN